MRLEVKEYVKKIIKQHKMLEPICEIGSYQVEGQEGFADMRPFFPKKKYIGCDNRLGPGVDRVEDIHFMSFKDNSMGTVLILDTLEHVANVYRALEELYRILKPGGLIIITSVMNFPVHNYPDDYWRFTPKAFELLLEKFEKFDVEYDGDKNFPTGIYGYGIKKKENPKIKDYLIEVNLNDTNSIHAKVIQLIDNNQTVLEFGCSNGYVSKILQEKGCEVVGIEINKKAAEQAKQYCKKVIVGDIEQLDFNKLLGKAQFDYIIFADVLEHLKNSKLVLSSVKKLLNKNGKLIISIPNIAHASIRLELLTGNFEYEKYGILDDTHLKYFTKKSIARLLNDCGYYVEKIDAVTKDLTQNTIKDYLLKIGVKPNKNIQKVFQQPDALAYQYIIVASLNRPSNYSLSTTLSQPLKTLNYTELEIENYRKEIENYRKEIEKLTNTRGWKIISFLHNVRIKIPYIKNL